MNIVGQPEIFGSTSSRNKKRSHEGNISQAKYFSRRLHTSKRNAELIVMSRQKHLKEERLETLKNIARQPGHTRI